MLDCTFTDTVTVRRASTRDVHNKVEYTEVKDEAGCPLPVKCRFERRRRRVITLEGVERDSDASMVFRRDKAVDIAPEDLIVTARGEVYQILTYEDVVLLGTTADYGRLTLGFTRTEVPPDFPRF